MCRLMAYIGSPMLIADVVLWPDRSIIKQSYDARERKKDPTLPSHLQFGNLNGDGFGIGWYSSPERRAVDPSPCVFTAITPAWNNENLSRLSCKIVSPLIFAHVRAAYPGMPVSEQNCHPFQSGRYLFMHNGVVGGFAQIRRTLLGLLSDQTYNTIQSFHSDSAVSFALFLQQLPDTVNQQPPDVLLRAMQATMAAIAQAQAKHGVTTTSLLNFILSDGTTLLATRYVWPDTESPASLYYAEGASFKRVDNPKQCMENLATKAPNLVRNASVIAGAAGGGCSGGGGAAPCGAAADRNVSGSSVLQESSYDLTYGERGAEVAFVSSEPITGSTTDWVPVPKNTALVITREKGGLLNIMRAPITSGAPDAKQGEVTVCLEAINRGITAKARPWLPRDPLLPSTQRDTSIPSLLQPAAPQPQPYAPTASRTHRFPPHDDFPTSSSRGLPVPCGAAASSASSGGVFGSWGAAAHGGDGAMALAASSLNLAGMLSAGSGALTDDGGGAMAVCGMPAGPTPCRESDEAMRPEAGGRCDDARRRQLRRSSTGLVTHMPATNTHFEWLDLESHEHMRLTGHDGAVLSAVVDTVLQRLYTASADCSIKVWSLIENRCIQTLDAHKRPVTHLVLRGRWLFSACGRKLRVWDTHGFKMVQVIKLTNGSGNIRSLEVSGSGGMAYLGCQDSSIQAFLLDEARLLEHTSRDAVPLSDDPADASPQMATDPLSGHVGCVNALALCCSKYLCSGGADAMIRVWSADSLKLLRVLRGHRGAVRCLLALDNLLMSGARDNTIRVWDMDMDMTCRRTLTGHKDDVTDLAAMALSALPNGVGKAHSSGNGAAPPGPLLRPCTVVASASADGTIRIWSLTWTCLCILSLPPKPVERVNPWSTFTAPVHRPLRTPAALCSALSHGLVVAGYADGEVRMWHCEDVYTAALQVYCSDIHLMEDVETAVALAAELNGQRRRSTVGTPLLGLWEAPPPPHYPVPPTSPAPTSWPHLVVPELSNVGCAATAVSAMNGTVSNGASVPGTPHCVTPRRGSLAGSAPDAAASTATPAIAPAARGAASAPLLRLPSGDGAAYGGSFAVATANAAAARHTPPQLSPAVSRRGPGMLSAAFSNTPPAPPPNTDCGCHRPGDEPPFVVDINGRPVDAALLSSAQGSGVLDRFASADVGYPGPSAQTSHSALSCQTSTMHAELRSMLLSPREGSCTGLTLGSTCSTPPGVYGPLGLARDPSPAPFLLDPELTRLLERRMTKSVIINGAFGCTDQQLEQCLREFVRIKSVSSDPQLHDECMKGAKYLAKLLEWLGASVKVVPQQSEDKCPVVLGRLGHDPLKPTVTFYGHYDVQPAVETDWMSNPFELNSVNDYLYGRGTSDNKGPILAFIFAVKELLDGYDTGASGGSNGGAGTPNGGASGGGGGTGGGLPVNVAFIFEGEEENGSTGFAEAVEQNLQWFDGTQLIVMSNTLWVGENVPCLTYGMRGMLSASIQVSGPERDLHSGNDGGVFNEPMLDLIKVLSTLAGSGSDIKVPGFYDGVAPGLVDRALASLANSDEFTLDGYKSAIGVPALTPAPTKRDLLAARWCRPCLSIVDMRPGVGGPNASEAQACYRFGPTRFSVIPRTAVGKVSVRFVPNQDADALVGRLRDHMASEFAKLGSSNTVALHVEARGNWWEAQPNSHWLKMAAVAVRREWGCDPLFVREGGTMPVASALERMLGAPALLIPLGQSSDGCHLANERIRRTNLFRGKNVIRLLLEEVAGLGGSGSAAGGGSVGAVVGGPAVA